MEELVQIFLEESREILQQVEFDLIELEKNPTDKEIINRIFRGAHTIKGSAGLTGLDCISSLAHRLEDMLDIYRSTGEVMPTDCFNIVFKSMDMLNKMVDMTAQDETIPEDMADELKKQLSNFINESNSNDSNINNNNINDSNKKETDKNCDNNNGSLPNEAKSIFEITLKFEVDILESGHDPLRFIREVQEKGQLLEVNANISNLPVLEEFDPYKMYLSWQVILEADCNYHDLEDIFLFVLDDNDITITDVTGTYRAGSENLLDDLPVNVAVENAAVVEIVDEGQLHKSLQKPIGKTVNENAVAPKQVEATVEKQKAARENEQVNTIRVDTRRLENVLNFVAELVISQSKLKELVSKQSQVDVEVFSSFREVDQIIRRLQEEVMKTSMIPVGNTFTRFQRMVRDTASEQGKEIELIVNGQETELDKRVIEQINDPLKHMIRNSIDHGIESPDERQAQGKPRQGTIWLNAYHQEGSIVIEVRDDGRGLDGEKVREKAIAKGLIEEEQKLSIQEMQKLIMMPGFSTAEKITDISGRGVGLDVVATNILSLKGSIDSQSEKGKGTKFLIKLPLTLAIIDGMMITVGTEKFIIPLSAIVKFIKAAPGDIKTVEGKGLAIHLRNDYVPLVPLYQLLGVQAYKEEPTEGILVIIKDARKEMALLVDDILGQEQVVTKSLSDNYKQVDGVNGATILGDGRVAAILDVPTLMKMAGNVYGGV